MRLLTILLALFSIGTTTNAQSPEVNLTGVVLDADDGRPLVGAAVLLVEGVALESVRSLSSEAVRTIEGVRSAVTGVDGDYTFSSVGTGALVLRVQRVGYGDATVAIAARAGASTDVSVALRVEPVELASLVVIAAGTAPSTRMTFDVTQDDRPTVEEARRRRALSPDARILTAQDVAESVSLAEPDVLRAMQRFAGVSTRDDWTAELWTRGAPWGETLVHLDGVRILNPLHGFGIFSGFSTQTVGEVYFRPGVRVSDRPEGGTASVDITSRSGVGLREWDTGAGLSLASVDGWLRGPVQDGRGGVAATIRRSYVDAAAGAVDASGFPYRYLDGQLRVDIDTPHGIVTGSGFVSSDAIQGELPDLTTSRAAWGNWMTQLAFSPRLAGQPVRLWLAASKYWAWVRVGEDRSPDGPHVSEARPLDHTVQHTSLGARVGSDGDAWQAGGDLTYQRAHYTGVRPSAYQGYDYEDSAPEVATRRALARASVWARSRWSPVDPWEVEASLRIGSAGSTTGVGLDVQPTLQSRIRVSERSSVTAAAGRSLQFSQSPASIGPDFDVSMPAGRYWEIAGAATPVLDTRTVSLGGEYQLPATWLLTATAYQRSVRGSLLPDPRPGPLRERVARVSGTVRGRGVEVTARKLTGRWTGAIAVSGSRTRAEVDAVRFTPPTARPYTLDLSMSYAWTTSTRIAAAYTQAAGLPYARIHAPCSADSCATPLRLADPFARTGPGYSSLDVMLTSHHTAWSADLTWYVQLRNVLGRDNAVYYRETAQLCRDPNRFSNPCPDGSPPTPVDRFTPGIPIAPAVGLRLRF